MWWRWLRAVMRWFPCLHWAPGACVGCYPAVTLLRLGRTAPSAALFHVPCSSDVSRVTACRRSGDIKVTKANPAAKPCEWSLSLHASFYPPQASFFPFIFFFSPSFFKANSNAGGEQRQRKGLGDFCLAQELRIDFMSWLFDLGMLLRNSLGEIPINFWAFAPPQKRALFSACVPSQAAN